MVYSPQSSSSGNPIADLIAQAIMAAVEKGAPNYMPLTIEIMAPTAGRGLSGRASAMLRSAVLLA